MTRHHFSKWCDLSSWHFSHNFNFRKKLCNCSQQSVAVYIFIPVSHVKKLFDIYEMNHHYIAALSLACCCYFSHVLKLHILPFCQPNKMNSRQPTLITWMLQCQPDPRLVPIEEYFSKMLFAIRNKHAFQSVCKMYTTYWGRDKMAANWPTALWNIYIFF